MTKIPQVKPRQVEKVLLSIGFQLVRQKGSHRLYKKGKLRVTIPYHNKTLKKGTLNNIIKRSDLTLKDFIDSL